MRPFRISRALEHATTGDHYDGEAVALAHRDAGFEVIPLGGIQLVIKTFPSAETADAYIATCVTPYDGQVILREPLDEGEVRLRVCVPTFVEAGDRSKIPVVKRWSELPFDVRWWQSDQVELPPGWEHWGTTKKGKSITERRGDPRNNVGLRTGAAAGLVVIDIDRREGLDGLANLKERFGDRFDELFPPTYMVRSPTGGLHLYYQSEASISNSAGALVAGVDVRGDGGLVVAAGSVRLNAKRYTIAKCIDIAALPTETERLLLSLRTDASAKKLARNQAPSRRLASSPETVLQKCLALYPKIERGTRHSVLMSVAGYARNLLADDQDLERAIRQFAEVQGVAERDPDDLDRIVSDAKNLQRAAPASTSRVQILVDTDQARVVRELEQALSCAAGLYNRGGALVRVLPPLGSSNAAPVVQAIPRESLGPWSTDVVEWIREKMVEGVPTLAPCNPPAWAIGAIHTSGRWPNIPYLSGVAEHPVFLRDGRVLGTSGYDPQTGLLLVTTVAVAPALAEPTRDDALRALEEFAEMVCDFPFADGVARSAALAAMLTPLARHAIHGCVPLMVIDKSTRGVGGSLLSDVVSTLCAGRSMPRMTQASSDEEQRKVITSILIDASSLVLLDNINAPLGGYALDALLTAETWRDRLLGTNIAISLPVRATFFATGNNIVFKGDTSRRALRIRMVSPMENPEERQGFRHPRLLAWIAEERSRLLLAGLIMLRAFHVAGRPLPQTDFASWGSFDEWSDLVRGTLVWLGLPDPGLARGALDDAVDGEKTVLAELVYGWAEIALEPHAGLTARDALDLIAADASGRQFALLRNLFAMPNGSLLPARDVVAKFLRKYKDRVIDGIYLAAAGSARTKTTLWVVRIAKQSTVPMAHKPPDADVPIARDALDVDSLDSEARSAPAQY